MQHGCIPVVWFKYIENVAIAYLISWEQTVNTRTKSSHRLHRKVSQLSYRHSGHGVSEVQLQVTVNLLILANLWCQLWSVLHLFRWEQDATKEAGLATSDENLDTASVKVTFPLNVHFSENWKRKEHIFEYEWMQFKALFKCLFGCTITLTHHSKRGVLNPSFLPDLISISDILWCQTPATRTFPRSRVTSKDRGTAAGCVNKGKDKSTAPTEVSVDGIMITN